jgi:hypothetical protein
MAVYVRHIPEVSIEQSPARTRIVVPTACATSDLMTISGVMLAWVGIVGAMLLASLSNAWHPNASHEFRANIVPLVEAPAHHLAAGAVLALSIVMLVIGLGAIGPIVLEMAMGREIIDLSSKRVTIRRRLGPMRWKRVIPCDEIAAIRDVEPPRTWRRRVLAYRPMWHGRNGTLELWLADGRRVRFATVEPGTNHRLIRGTVRKAMNQVADRDPERPMELLAADAK